MKLIIAILIINCLTIVLGKSPHVCGTQTTCSDCLFIHKECAWCSKWDDSINIKCNLKENLLEAGCDEEFIEIAGNSEINILKNNDFRDMNNGDDETTPAIQLKPQHIQLKLTSNEEVKLKIEVRPARNYPLDLYFLMDASYSMIDDMNTIAQIGDELMSSLKNLTENYRLGFGTFSDKPTMPWTQIDPEHLKNPCMGDNKQCLPPYEFRHMLSLTNNQQIFIDQIKENMITGNLDNVDGGLDALMQVIVCGKIIGWSNDTRRIIILASDSLFHTAGDGKLGGIIKPNDEHCHLDSTGFYIDSLQYDYPSISQLYKRLKQNKINVIFAVTEQIKLIYDELHNLIPETTLVARLEEDSSNILELLKKGYQQIVSKLNLKDNAADSNLIQMKYLTNCGHRNGQFVETSTCSNVQFGRVYQFEIDFKLLQCPVDDNLKKQRIVIEEANLGNEQIIIDVELRCGCQCNNTDWYQLNDPKCNEHGVNVCGLCQCEKPWLGKYCECNSDIYESSIQLQEQCRPNGTIDKCSNQGDCVCGTCECDENFSGQYCECSPCDEIHGQLCSGHGVCDCGQCVCKPEYTGVNCECPTRGASEWQCIMPDDELECHGNGQCHCGQCICDVNYIGRYCQQLFDDNCQTYQQCVQNVFDDNNDQYCSFNTTRFHIVQLSSDPIANGYEDDNNAIECTFRNSTKTNYVCDYYFKYKSESTNGTIQLVLISKECQQIFVSYLNRLWPWLLLALLLYIVIVAGIKCHQIRQEQIEYAQFEKNLAGEKQQMNPLYRSPMTHYRVPTPSIRKTQ